MNARTIFASLGPMDIRNVFRDSSLKWMFFLPIMTALVIRWGVPPLGRWLLENEGFDLAPYYPVLLGYFFVVMSPITFGVLTGFLLIDEKDDQTIVALQVTPLSLKMYLLYRALLPMILTVAMMFIIFPLAGIGALSNDRILVTAVAAAPIGPMFALYLASIAQNKVQGFALMKLSGLVLLLPTFGFFVEPELQNLFGIIPTYWPMKVYWLFVEGNPDVWPALVLALVYQGGLTWLMARRFIRVLYR